MAVALTAKERDKSVLALRDLKGLLEYTRKVEFENLDEAQTILAGYGLQIAPVAVERPAPPPPIASTQAGTAPEAAPTPATGLGTNDTYWVETLILSYRAYKKDNRKGYMYSVEQVGKLLLLLCRLAKIPFKI